jgi:hypothetical protein
MFIHFGVCIYFTLKSKTSYYRERTREYFLGYNQMFIDFAWYKVDKPN